MNITKSDKTLLEEIKIIAPFFSIKVEQFIKDHGGIRIAHAVIAQAFNNRGKKNNIN